MKKPKPRRVVLGKGNIWNYVYVSDEMNTEDVTDAVYLCSGGADIKIDLKRLGLENKRVTLIAEIEPRMKKPKPPKPS